MKLALVVLAACGGLSTMPSAGPPPANRVEPVPRATPAPTVGWQATWQLAAFPAVARGGEIVVVAAHDSDGGRGYPNLRLEVHDRGDKVIQRIPVMISNEYETFAPDGVPAPALTQRLDAANRELAKLHGLHDLVAMHALELEQPADGSEPHLAIGDGLDVDWNRDHLHVFHHNSDHPLVTLDGSRWLVPDAAMGATAGATCHNPAYLANVFHAPLVNVIVVEIGYRGTDTCWEPGSQLHVVSW